jgi:hypothetical protein
MPMTQGTHTLEFSGSPPKIGWLPPTIRGVPVVDRASAYQPPTSHLERPVEDSGPSYGTFALDYLRVTCWEAKERVAGLIQI